MQIKYIDRSTGQELIETPPGEGYLKFFYHNPLGKVALNSLVKKKGLTAYYGKLMSKPKSVKKIQPFVDQLGIDMSESQKSVDEFTSFNDFFYRKLKPGTRPMQEGLVSPGDGKILAFERVSDVNTFYVKGREFTLQEYLCDDELAAEYKDSSMIILRLAPNDYHRYHFPYSGTPSAMTQMKGSYFSVSPYALAANFTKVFCENKREFCILNTPDKGELLISPVGATMVGTIIETFEPYKQIEKGDEMGYFAFGGSTIVMLLDSDKTTLDADIIKNTKKGLETFVKLGEKIGQ